MQDHYWYTNKLSLNMYWILILVLVCWNYTKHSLERLQFHVLVTWEFYILDLSYSKTRHKYFQVTCKIMTLTNKIRYIQFKLVLCFNILPAYNRFQNSAVRYKYIDLVQKCLYYHKCTSTEFFFVLPAYNYHYNSAVRYRYINSVQYCLYYQKCTSILPA